MTSTIHHAIDALAAGGHLNQEEAGRAFQIIMSGGATPAQMAAVLMALRLNGETRDEIAGAAQAMRAKMEHIAAPPDTIDVCGTGGDGTGSLNISTAVALVLAGCGVPVAKHGNRSVSSKSGSADVLAALGVQIQADKALMEKALAEAHIAFLFAPLYHKAMRHVAPVRQELGIRTIFNLLGPLVNPASPKRQLVGIYDKEKLECIAAVLHTLGSERAWVVHGSDGMDELTLSGETEVAELKNGEIRRFSVTPEEAGLVRAEPEALAGRDPAHNALELSHLLAGRMSAYRDSVVLNAAAALIIADKAETLSEGAAKAAAAIDEGRAQEALLHLVRISTEHA